MIQDILGSKNAQYFLKETMSISTYKDTSKLEKVYLKDYFELFKDIGYKRVYFIFFAEGLKGKVSNEDKFLDNANATAKNLNNKCFHIFLWNNLLVSQSPA